MIYHGIYAHHSRPVRLGFWTLYLIGGAAINMAGGGSAIYIRASPDEYRRTVQLKADNSTITAWAANGNVTTTDAKDDIAAAVSWLFWYDKVLITFL